MGNLTLYMDRKLHITNKSQLPRPRFTNKSWVKFCSRGGISRGAERNTFDDVLVADILLALRRSSCLRSFHDEPSFDELRAVQDWPALSQLRVRLVRIFWLALFLLLRFSLVCGKHIV